MLSWFWIAFFNVVRFFVSLRYSIEVRGKEKLTPNFLNRDGGILFIPNHPAHVDPLFIFLILWPQFRMRPLVIDYVFRLPMMRFAHKLVKSIPVPSFESGINEYKIKQAENSIQLMAEGLKNKDNFIIYPSGRLKTSPKELLAGSAGVYELLKECPKTNVVLVRTTGLWGSSFSTAITGTSPNLPKTTAFGIKTLFKNLLFFTPRRKILIELEPNPEDFPREGFDRIGLNRYLENWFNRYPDESGHVWEEEPLKLVSYSFWKKDLLTPLEKNKKDFQDVEVSEETREKIYKEIRKILENPSLEIKPEMHLAFDLGMDSLNIAEFITFVTKNFDVKELYPEDLETIGTVLAIAEGGGEVKRKKEPASQYFFQDEPNRPSPELPIGRILPESFLNSCARMKGFIACGDDQLGVLTYDRLKKTVLVLAQHFRTYEEEKVAVLLPASVGAYVLILAIQMAGKVPVMLNWTLGPRYLESMMETSGAQKIITSWKFLDRLSNVQFGKCLDKIVLLEEIRASLSLKMKLRGLYLTRCSLETVIEKMGLASKSEEDPCVILFTSGTEAAPKGVPLSHKNIIANQRSAMQCIDLISKDVLYGILPPFHSFGFSVAGLLPLLSGVKVAFYPDPTDSFALAEGIKRWKVALFCSAPSFLKGLLHAAAEGDLDSVRYFVAGAEKVPEDLFKKVEELNTQARLLEGYGITECAPVLTLSRPNLPPKGVGRILPDIELITIHPETKELLKPGEDGEICVRGPNVFQGYLQNAKNPFISIDGKLWYQTGDLGHLDPDGTLFLSGRLKRFAKIGGEMISLGGIEEVLLERFFHGKSLAAPTLAVCVEEKEEGKAQLILFTTATLTKEEVNQALYEAGFSNLVKISNVQKVEEIPLMGTGKTDYRRLQGLC